MDVEQLVTMANQIGQFYASLPDREEGKTSIADHIRRFWDPRMRRAMLAHITDHGGHGLDPMVHDALVANQAKWAPPPPHVAPA
jgi:formate dehydrogenase subunit delta